MRRTVSDAVTGGFKKRKIKKIKNKKRNFKKLTKEDQAVQ